MSGRVVVVAAVAGALMVASPAVASTHKSVTATGTGQARVHPTNRHRNSSIVAAVAAARRRAIKKAVNNAHRYAVLYAKALGLTLGSPTSVSDQQSGGFYGPYPGGYGPFGLNKYCGTIRKIVGKYVPGTKPTFTRVHRCIVPRFAYDTLVVTYAAS